MTDLELGIAIGFIATCTVFAVVAGVALFVDEWRSRNPWAGVERRGRD